VNLAGISLAILSQPVATPAEIGGGDLLAFLLLSVLAVALLLGMICVFFVLRLRRSPVKKGGRADGSRGEMRKPNPLLFDSPSRWFAIKSNNPQAVQAALRLHNAMFCSWEQGLAEARDFKLFLSPPIRGWILVIGVGLPDPADDVDDLFRMILSLSRSLGQVQFFSANRIVNSHSWVQADSGQIVRAYAWSGTTLWNQGAMTAAEAELGLACYDYGESVAQKLSSSEPQRANAEKVPSLAGRWSLDPTALDENAINQRLGIIGSLSFPKPH
jgi:hypothetical protein